MEKPRRIWLTTLFFIITTLATVTLIPWYGFSYGFDAVEWTTMGLFMLFTGTGITAGYHRLWSHKAFEAHWLLRLWLAIWGGAAVQNSILHWAGGHRRHHAFVDDPAKDPYAATRGFWYSHIGWMLRDYDPLTSDFSKLQDLKRDPIVIWQHKLYLPLLAVINIALPMFLGWLNGDIWGMLLLAGLLRVVLNQHFTFFINSLAHIWGRQPYTDKNTAKDNDFLALLTYGEGYHNFHHIFQFDYRNGIHWWQFDPTKWMIWSCSKIGLTSNLKRTSEFKILRAKIETQYLNASKRLKGQQAREKLEAQYQAVMESLREWSQFRQQWLEGKMDQLEDLKQQYKEQWQATDLKQKANELKAAFEEQQARWKLARFGQLT
ncbi:fatty acid desaturase [Pelagibaculum spongiae]|uniref:Acyl-CoA desaturase n=1 Tax=Pelagibaculum spongiae TaxID=2080658 RepID=A0A2V1GP99_9GAMM|nr:fatty acid desaturase [Pelagibaculum spongiae]PVZ64347.1 acyl-CoA desaturase [Pelagibaculum spongiae]